ncbi:Regucalcin [Vanrija pseudolonga]|uniref:Regucalcin n=1 Tax=Vanrija pseudolonga TaxID=143232 RepID=A0AAF0YE07_9TREE|nr:Regucalcin [Vanrija pseudolonga]
MPAPLFTAEIALPAQTTLGEGICWDPRTQLVHWVDIDESDIHSYDPVTKLHGVAHYPETKFIGTISPRGEAGPGLVAAFDTRVVIVNPPPPSTAGLASRVDDKAVAELAAPLQPDLVAKGLVRFNDGASDPRGRFVVGSCAVDEQGNVGELWSIAPDGTQKKILDGIGCSNGIDWSLDSKLMYYIDSNIPEIHVFDYDVDTGLISNRRVFATAPPDAGDGAPTKGVFDGLVVDGVGNVWSARWADSRVVAYSPDGELLLHIRTPGAKSPTIPAFGGKDLTTVYVATASANLAGEGEIQAQWPASGDVFKIEAGEGTPLGAALGKAWKGRVRHAFGG